MKAECPNCNQHIEADDSLAGLNVSCPTCEADFTLPLKSAPPDAPPILATLNAAVPSTPVSDIANPRPAKTVKRKLLNRYTIIGFPIVLVLICYLVGYIRDAIQIPKNTAYAWAKYQEIENEDSGLFDLDLKTATIKRRAAFYEVYCVKMDNDLKNLIASRIFLFDKLIQLMDQAETKDSALQTEANIKGFLGGMVGGILNPDNPARGGMVVGSMAASGVKDKQDSLLRTVNSAVTAWKEEKAKLDSYESDLKKTLSKRYHWQ